MPAKPLPAYNASAIQALEGLDGVRKRPSMYIGGTNSRGLTHLLNEILDNSVDEATAGFCNHIDVTLYPDDSAAVVDNGRGIPVDTAKGQKLPAIIQVFTVLHAGGKFGGAGSGYTGVSGGLNGVGSSVVNAMSTRLTAEVKRGGKLHRVEFDYGIPGQFVKGKFGKSNEIAVVGKAPAKETGTSVRWWVDRKIFPADAAYDLSSIRDRVSRTCYLVPGLSITLADLRGGTHQEYSETFESKAGLADFVDFLSSAPPIGEVISFEGVRSYSETVPVLVNDKLVHTEVEREMKVRVALRWQAAYEPIIESYVNSIRTSGGTHVTGFERGLVKTINEIARATRVLKSSQESFIKDDVTEGLVAAIVVEIPEPQFESQTKDVLGASQATAIVNQIVTEGLTAFLTHSRKAKATKAILAKIAETQRGRLSARAVKELNRTKKAIDANMPDKLSDCKSRDITYNEIYLVEGDSAAGSCKAARNSDFQAILPIRGKILNSLRADVKRVLENDECTAIIQAIGAGFGKSFDLESVRYGKVIINCDSDVDGSHIRVLLLTFFYRMMPELIKEGRVYAAVPPLYRFTLAGSGEVHYAYSEQERVEFINAMNKRGDKLRTDGTGLSRFKGLGEMNAAELGDTTMTGPTRILHRFTIGDAAETAKLLETLMGSEVAPRREYIVDNALSIDSSSIDA